MPHRQRHYQYAKARLSSLAASTRSVDPETVDLLLEHALDVQKTLEEAHKAYIMYELEFSEQEEYLTSLAVEEATWKTDFRKCFKEIIRVKRLADAKFEKSGKRYGNS